MRCIFCKGESDASVSVEHVIPESLGNTEHVLPSGWVCDTCNNYLGCKIERPFLNGTYGSYSRFEMGVPNKKGRVPPPIGMHAESRTLVEAIWTPEEGLSIGAARGEDETKWIRASKAAGKGTLYFPSSGMPLPSYNTSRFIGKIALEVLAYRSLHVAGANDEIVDKPELDELRNYVRRGNPRLVWPVHIRRIYPQESTFPDGDESPYQVLHEFDILVTDADEFYVVVAIFGIEYTINLGGPELDGFLEWLSASDNRSPLYLDDD